MVAAIRGGVTYANVHTTAYPGGEIRAQLNGGKGGWDDDFNGHGWKNGKGHDD